MPDARSLRAHAQTAVEADRLTVQHRVVQDVLGQLCELAGVPESARMRNGAVEACPRVFAHSSENRGVEDAGRDRAHPDQLAGEVPSSTIVMPTTPAFEAA